MDHDPTATRDLGTGGSLGVEIEPCEARADRTPSVQSKMRNCCSSVPAASSTRPDPAAMRLVRSLVTRHLLPSSPFPPAPRGGSPHRRRNHSSRRTPLRMAGIGRATARCERSGIACTSPGAFFALTGRRSAASLIPRTRPRGSSVGTIASRVASARRESPRGGQGLADRTARCFVGRIRQQGTIPPPQHGVTAARRKRAAHRPAQAAVLLPRTRRAGTARPRRIPAGSGYHGRPCSPSSRSSDGRMSASPRC